MSSISLCRSMVAGVAVIVSLQAGCSGPGTGAGQVNPTPHTGGDQSAQVTGQGSGAPCSAGDTARATGADHTGAGAQASKGVPCVEPVCMYHGGTDSYHLCLNAGAGECFHHGAACEPADRCMYDRKSDAYRTCEKPGDGRCAAFGAVCDPPGMCVYSRADRRYHVCEARAKDGRCTRFGALCDVPR